MKRSWLFCLAEPDRNELKRCDDRAVIRRYLVSLVPFSTVFSWEVQRYDESD